MESFELVFLRLIQVKVVIKMKDPIFSIGDVQHHWPFGSDGEVKEADG